MAWTADNSTSGTYSYSGNTVWSAWTSSTASTTGNDSTWYTWTTGGTTASATTTTWGNWSYQDYQVVEQKKLTKAEQKAQQELQAKIDQERRAAAEIRLAEERKRAAEEQKKKKEAEEKAMKLLEEIISTEQFADFVKTGSFLFEAKGKLFKIDKRSNSHNIKELDKDKKVIGSICRHVKDWKINNIDNVVAQYLGMVTDFDGFMAGANRG